MRLFHRSRAAAGSSTKMGTHRSAPPESTHMFSIAKAAPPQVKDSFGFINPGLVRWTPAQAAKVFRELRYEFNRDEKKAKQHISALARMMRSKSWRDGGAVEFARLPDGKLTLVDGHHRMLAQVEAAIDVVWTVIIHDVSDIDELRSLFWTYDTTLRKRTMSNVYAGVNAASAMGLPAMMAVAIGRAAVFIDNGMKANVGAGLRTYTPEENLTLASQWAAEGRMFAACVNIAAGPLKSKLRGSQITAAGLVTFRAKPNEAHDFWAGLAADDGLRKGDPRKTLLDWMRDTHMAGSGLSSAAGAAARAWNAWDAGTDLNIIRLGRQPIPFAGSNYVVKP
jgi:hypothetical protein